MTSLLLICPIPTSGQRILQVEIGPTSATYAEVIISCNVGCKISRRSITYDEFMMHSIFILETESARNNSSRSKSFFSDMKKYIKSSSGAPNRFKKKILETCFPNLL